MKKKHTLVPILLTTILLIPIIVLVIFFIIFNNKKNSEFAPGRSNPFITTINYFPDSKTRPVISEEFWPKRKQLENLNHYHEEIAKQTINDKKIIFTISDQQFVDNAFKENYKQASFASQQRFDAIYNYNTGWDDITIDEAFNQLKTKFENTILTKNWNQLSGIKSNEQDLKPFIDWDTIINRFSKGNNVTPHWIKNKLLSFYNFMFRTYGETNVLRFLITIEAIKNKDFSGAVSHYNTGLGPSFMYFNDDQAKLTAQSQYDNAFWSANDPLTTFVHEYGHALDIFFRSPRKLRAYFNNFSYLESTNYKSYRFALNDLNRKKDFKATQWWNKYIVSYTPRNVTNAIVPANFEPSVALENYLAQQTKTTDPVRKRLLLWSVVPSTYGRFYGLRETFAEAKSFLINTPKEKRGQNWELLANFFMDQLPRL